MLNKKIDRALHLIEAASKIAKQNGSPLELAYSGGKDSDVMLHLANRSGVNFKAVYKNTTIDPPHTIARARAKGVEILKPKMSFREIIEKSGYPSRWRRFCCGILKEYKTCDYALVGVRRAESSKRAKLYKEPEECRVFKNNEKVRQYYPLLDREDEDIAKYILTNNVDVHPLYYDDSGKFCVKRRLGCIGCPLASANKRIKQFKQYPKFVRMWVKAGEKFLQTHPKSKIVQFHQNGYSLFTGMLFTDSYAEFKEKYGANLFGGSADCKTLLEDYFKIDLTL